MGAEDEAGGEKRNAVLLQPNPTPYSVTSWGGVKVFFSTRESYISQHQPFIFAN
jgi:hypothetical protein